MHMLSPCEYHADTATLVHMLEGGHHGVRLDAEAWDRLITWIDLGTPAQGTWHEIVGEKKVYPMRDRRRAMMKRYAGIDEDPEAIPPAEVLERAFIVPPPDPPIRLEAGVRRLEVDRPRRSIDLGNGLALELVLIPAGTFVMGDADGVANQRPPTCLEVESGFWIGCCEISNEQYAQFDPKHNSRLEGGDFLQFSIEERGYPVNAPQQPVCRVSWNEAMAFCAWLSERTGEEFTLPDEAVWEYACRAGTATPLWYGAVDVDFARYANLADASLRHVDTFAPWSLPSGAIPLWRPTAENVNDGFRVSAPIGSFEANPWGLHDMHGNVAEWTVTTYKGWRPEAGDCGVVGKKVVRGGSWYDHPKRAGSGYRIAYAPWQRVFNVGFRVVCSL